VTLAALEGGKPGQRWFSAKAITEQLDVTSLRLGHSVRRVSKALGIEKPLEIPLPMYGYPGTRNIFYEGHLWLCPRVFETVLTELVTRRPYLVKLRQSFILEGAKACHLPRAKRRNTNKVGRVGIAPPSVSGCK